MNASLRILTLLTLLSLSALAHGQDEVIEEAVEPRRYTIEVIIFRYAQDVSTGTEIFPADQPRVTPPEYGDGPSFGDEEPGADTEPETRVYRDIELSLLSRDEYTMGDVMSHLRRLDVYEPLMHFAWTQTTWPDSDTLPLDLAVMGRKPAGLDGTLRLYLGRFLHLVVDLELDAPGQRSGSRNSFERPAADTDRSAGYADRTAFRNRFDSGAPAPVHYRIAEDRILKSGELRYFDHPKFGVLAKAQRAEVDTPEEDGDETAAPAESELLGYPAD